jgi:hypothetical protein
MYFRKTEEKFSAPDVNRPIELATLRKFDFSFLLRALVPGAPQSTCNRVWNSSRPRWFTGLGPSSEKDDGARPN